MNCEKYEPLIALYIEGDLSEGKTIGLEAHLRSCDRCNEFAQEMRESQFELKKLAQLPLSSSERELLRAGVLRALTTKNGGGKGYLLHELWDRLAPVLYRPAFSCTIIILIVLCAGLYFGFHTRSNIKQTVVVMEPGMASEPSADKSLQAKSNTSGEPVKLQSRGALKPQKNSHRRMEAVARVEPPPSVAIGESGNDVEVAANASAAGVIYKIKTDDPRVVIYWIKETDGGQAQ